MSTSELTANDALEGAPPTPLTARRIAAVLPFAAALVMSMLTFWTVDIFAPALPELKTNLGLTTASAGLVFSFMFVGRLCGNLPAVFMLDRIGAPLTAVIGAALLCGGSVMAAVADGQDPLLVARAFQGLGVALMINATLRSLIAAKPERGVAMTIFGVAGTVGGILGLQTGGYLTTAYSWRANFVFSAIIAGAAVLLCAVSAVVVRRTSPTLQSSAPAADVAISAPRKLLIGAFLLNLIVCVNYSVWALMPLYTERTFGTTPHRNANLLLMITLMHLAGAFPAGWSIRRFGAVPTLIGGLLISMGGTLLVLPMPADYLVAFPLLLYGFGMVTASNAAGDIVLHLGRGSSKSVSTLRFSADLGMVIGPAASGWIADDLGYSAPFVALPMLMSVAIGILILRGSALNGRSVAAI